MMSMVPKLLLLSAVITTVTGYTWDLSKCSCDVRQYGGTRKYTACGPMGISKELCLDDCNCCYDRLAPNQCYFNTAPLFSECCNVPISDRVKCTSNFLDLEGSPYNCRQAGCCYETGEIADVNFFRCYKRTEGCCDLLSKMHCKLFRVEAGYPGIAKERCLTMENTCWHEQPGCPYCFFVSPPCRCDVPVRNRKACANGKFEYSADECRKRGCCYRLKDYDFPRCYYPEARRVY